MKKIGIIGQGKILNNILIDIKNNSDFIFNFFINKNNNLELKNLAISLSNNSVHKLFENQEISKNFDRFFDDEEDQIKINKEIKDIFQIKQNFNLINLTKDKIKYKIKDNFVFNNFQNQKINQNIKEIINEIDLLIIGPFNKFEYILTLINLDDFKKTIKDKLVFFIPPIYNDIEDQATIYDYIELIESTIDKKIDLIISNNYKIERHTEDEYAFNNKKILEIKNINYDIIYEDIVYLKNNELVYNGNNIIKSIKENLKW